MAKRQYKIFFRKDDNPELLNTIVFYRSMQEVWTHELVQGNDYNGWVAVKCCTSGIYAWKNSKVDDAVIQRELALQKYVEGEKFN